MEDLRVEVAARPERPSAAARPGCAGSRPARSSSSPPLHALERLLGRLAGLRHRRHRDVRCLALERRAQVVLLEEERRRRRRASSRRGSPARSPRSRAPARRCRALRRAPAMKSTITASRSSAAPSPGGPTYASILPSAKTAIAISPRLFDESRSCLARRTPRCSPKR